MPGQRTPGALRRSDDGFALGFELEQNIFGKCTGETKGDKIGRAFAFEMGQHAARMKARYQSGWTRPWAAWTHSRRMRVRTVGRQALVWNVAQTFLSASSRDFPVPCFWAAFPCKLPELATEKSPELAGWKACATRVTLLPPAEPLSEGQIPIWLDSILGCLDSFPKDVGADGGEASAGLEQRWFGT